LKPHGDSLLGNGAGLPQDAAKNGKNWANGPRPKVQLANLFAARITAVRSSGCTVRLCIPHSTFRIRLRIQLFQILLHAITGIGRTSPGLCPACCSTFPSICSNCSLSLGRRDRMAHDLPKIGLDRHLCVVELHKTVCAFHDARFYEM
jgi:hypothetical protein